MTNSQQNKKEFKIVVPSNDEKTIFDGMLGRAYEFLIFEIDNNKINLIEKRKNPYAQTMQRLKTLDVYDLLEDCSVILSAKIGKKGVERLEKRGMQLVFAMGEIQEHLDKLLKIF